MTVEAHILTEAVQTAFIFDFFKWLIGILIVVCIFSWWVKRFCSNSHREETRETDVECRLLTLEYALVNKLAKSKDIDLDKEEAKIELSARTKFRERIYNQITKDYLDNEKKEGK